MVPYVTHITYCKFVKKKKFSFDDFNAAGKVNGTCFKTLNYDQNPVIYNFNKLFDASFNIRTVHCCNH